MAALQRFPVFPKAGVFRAATSTASAGRWFDANLMRFDAGVALPVGGNAAMPNADTDTPGRDILSWHSNDGKRWAVNGTDDALTVYCFNDQTLRDITPAGMAPLDPPGAVVGFGIGAYGMEAFGTARSSANIGITDISPSFGDAWSLDLFGEDLLFVGTQDGRLFRWSPSAPDTAPAVVPNAPIANRAVVVTEERHVVLLGAGGNPRNVAWSDQEEPEVWTPLVDNLAGDKLLETEGRSMIARRVASGVLILTDNDVHLMKYLGPPYAYGMNRIGENCGIASLRAISQAGGTTVWLGLQTFWQYTGSVSPLDCEVGDWLFSNINRDYVGRIFGAPNPRYGEHWFFWPDLGSTECNRYVVVSYTDKTLPWTIGQMSRSAGDMRAAMMRPLLAGQDGKLYLHEYGNTDNGASRVGKVWLETADVVGGEGDLRQHIRQVMQDFEGAPASVGYRFFFWEEADGEVYDTGVIPISNPSGLTDCEFSCRGFRMRIEALTDAPFKVGRTRLLRRPGGRI